MKVWADLVHYPMLICRRFLFFHNLPEEFGWKAEKNRLGMKYSYGYVSKLELVL